MTTDQSKPDRVVFNPVLPREALMGKIKKVRDSFGFIAGDDGQDYFFHWASVQKRSARDFRGLELRDRVSFIPQPPRNDEARGPLTCRLSSDQSLLENSAS